MTQKRTHALDTLQAYGVPVDADFHALSNATVERIIEVADLLKYRKRKDANGSRARCFYEYATKGAGPVSVAKQRDLTVKRYILDCIDATDYAADPQTTAEKLEFLDSTFRKEYGHALRTMPQGRAMGEWFAGLPSCCRIEWRNHEILQLLEQWGVLSATASEVARDHALEQWFNTLGVKAAQMIEGRGIPKD